MKYVYKNANIIDVEKHETLENKTISVENGLIAEIVDTYDTSDTFSCEIIDLQGKYLIPGLFNCHTHMTFEVGSSQAMIVQPGRTVQHVLIALENLATYIKTGVTFVRDVGDYEGITVVLRDSIKQGKIKMAPDVQTTARPICMTGGSTWNLNGIQADGEDECRKTARLLIREKIDWLKLMATGGTCTLGNKCAAEQLTVRELQAAVEEAHKAGIKVACHAQGIEGAMNAINAGVDCLEHGFELNDEAIELMIQKGIWLVPTLSASYEIKKRATAETNKEFIEKANINVDNVFKSFPKAYHAGVRCAAGTDCGSILNPHSNSCEELIIMVNELGFAPYDALEIGTINSARLCGVDSIMGSIAAGKKANFAVYADNPGEKIVTLRNCLMTVKNGEVLYKADEF